MIIPLTQFKWMEPISTLRLRASSMRFNGDFFDQLWKSDAVKIKSQGCQEKEDAADDNEGFF